MTQEKIDLEAGEMAELAALVAEALEDGESSEEVIDQLVSNGVDEDQAIGLVDLVETQLYQISASASRPTSSSDGEGLGWIIWIIVIIGMNVLGRIGGCAN